MNIIIFLLLAAVRYINKVAETKTLCFWYYCGWTYGIPNKRSLWRITSVSRASQTLAGKHEVIVRKMFCFPELPLYFVISRVLCTLPRADQQDLVYLSNWRWLRVVRNLFTNYDELFLHSVFIRWWNF